MWSKIATALAIGYLSMTRGFAYLGLPQIGLFIGEVVLGAFIALKPRAVIGTFVTALTRPTPFSPIAFCLFAFIVYGIWQLALAILGGRPVILSLQHFVFNYYAMYIFLGLFVAIHKPQALAQTMYYLAWFHGVYGVVWLLVLRELDLGDPFGTGVGPLGQPSGAAISILGLLCFTRSLNKPQILIPLALNFMILLALQVRAEWLGLALALALWAILAGQIKRVMFAGLAGLTVLAGVDLLGIELPGRAGDVSLTNIIVRIIAPISPEMAMQMDPTSGHHVGTWLWRTQWWEQIWLSIHSSAPLTVLGHGYGFDLFSLAPEAVRVGQAEDIRTPHNVFFFALGYSGWMGVTLFAALQAAIVLSLWRAFRITGQPMGILFWILAVTIASFSNFFETPFQAIPFYLIVGMALAPAMARQEVSDARLART